MDEAQKDFWFRPKRYGYGAEPSNWKGWLATFAYLFVVAAITWPLMLAPVSGRGHGELMEMTWVAVTAPPQFSARRVMTYQLGVAHW